MARKFLVSLDLVKNELQNAKIQNIAGPPGAVAGDKGLIFFDTADNILKWWNGSGWVNAQGGAGAVPATTVTTQAVGDSPVVGVATTYSREDHKHGREAFANPTATTTFGLSAVNGSAITLARSDHTHGTPTHDAAAHSAISRSALAAPTTDLSMGGFKLTSMGTPTVGTDATTKDYVDNLQAGLAWKDACRIATTANVTQSGLAAIDGVTPSAGDRILCKDQSTGTQNGIWVAAAGAWARSTDADAVGELDGATVFVTEGTANADKAFTCTTNAPITPGSTATTWVQFGAGTAYTAGNGLTLTGSTFDVVPLNGSIVVAADSVAVGFAGTGAAVTAARSDHDHSGIYAPVAHNHDGVYTKKFSAACAAAVTTTVNHAFATRDVTVEVYRNATPWDSVECDVERTDTNNILVRFATAPAAGDYRIVVTG